MRRKDREISEAEAFDITDRCEYAVIAMNDGGEPYCVPVSPVRIGKNLYFHGATAGKKTDLLRRDGRVCVTCVGDTRRMTDKFSTEYESAILSGTASEVTGDAEKRTALRALCERHTPANMADFDRAVSKSLPVTAVWRISIDRITGKRKNYGLPKTEEST